MVGYVEMSNHKNNDINNIRTADTGLFIATATLRSIFQQNLKSLTKNRKVNNKHTALLIMIVRRAQNRKNGRR